MDQAHFRIADKKGWEGSACSEILGLYALLHQQVYGVAPAELIEDWFPALSKINSFMNNFNHDPCQCVDFVRWVWSRERKRRARQPDSDFRIGWRYQFGQKLLTDYRVATRGQG